MKRFAIAISGLILVACGSGSLPSSPSSPTVAVATETNWRGVTRQQHCTDNSGGVACDGLHKLANFHLKLDPSGSPGEYQGALSSMFFVFTVRGRIGGDGAVTLTGQGSGLERLANLTAWNTHITSTGMTGSFTYTSTSAYGGDSPTVTGMLENVVPYSSFTDVPAESRFAMTLRTGSATRNAPVPPFSAGSTSYAACARLDNASTTAATVTFTMIAIGPDGREYTGTEPLFRPLTTLSPLSSLTGCSFAALTDANYTRPIATQYRLRAQASYGDGGIGHAEGTASLKVDRDTLPQLLPVPADHAFR